jgi:DNA-binding NarL/FixJ family response regulator
MAPVALPRSDLTIGRISHSEPDSAEPSSCDEQSLRRLAYRERPRWLLVGDCPEDETLLALFQSVRPAAFDSKVAVIGPAGDLERFERWLSYGALVYLTAGSSTERVARALHAADELDTGVYDRAFLEARQARDHQFASLFSRDGSLSKREREVLHLVARGFRNAEIAGELTIALNTVEFHMSHILDKLRAKNRTEAVERARVLGLG